MIPHPPSRFSASLLRIAAMTTAVGFAVVTGAAVAHAQSTTAQITVLYDAFGASPGMQQDRGYAALIETCRYLKLTYPEAALWDFVVRGIAEGRMAAMIRHIGGFPDPAAASAFVDRCLREWRGRNLPGDGEDLVHQLVVWVDAFHQPDALGLGGVDDLAGEDHFHRAAHADELW